MPLPRYHRQAVLFIGAWTLMVAGLILWDRLELTRTAHASHAEVENHLGTEAVVEGVIWVLGVAGLWTAFRRFQRHEDENSRMVAEMRAKERTLVSVVETVRAVVFVLGADGRIERFLPFDRDRGVGFASGNVLGRTLAEVMPAPAAEQLRPALAQLALTGQPQEIEFEWPGLAQRESWTLYLTPRNEDDGGHPGSIVVARDTTRRSKIEAALRDSEERFRLLYERSGEGILLSLPDGTYLSANAAACALLGRTEEEIRRAGRGEILDLTDPRLARLMEARERSGFARGELRVRRGDGSLIDVAGSSTNFLQRDGQRSFATLFHDVTAIRRAEQARRESEERYRMLFDQATDPIIVFPLEGNFQAARITEVNDAACRMIGYERDEILRLTAPELEAPSRRAELPARIAAIERHGRALFETEVLTRDGTLVPLEVHAQIISQAGGRILLSTMRDLRHRKQAAAEIARLANERRAILDTLTVGTALLIDRRVQWWNLAFEQILGLAGTPILGLEIAALYAHAAEYERIGREAYPALARGESYTTEVELQRPDRSRLWVRLVGRRLDPRDASTGSIWMLEDITARRAAEQAVRSSEAQLQGILTSTMDGILAVDTSGKVIRMNQRMFALWNFPPELTGTDRDEALLAWALGHLRDPESFLQKVQALYGSTEESSDELELRDGRVFERASAPMMADGVLAGRVWSFRDVTARVHSEREMRRSEARLAATLGAISDLLFVLDREGRFTEYHCPRGLRLLAPPADFLGRSFAEILPPPVSDQLGQSLEALAHTGETQSFDYSLEFGGHLTWWSASISRRIDRDEKWIGTVVVARDITDRKRAEQALRESEEKFFRAFHQAPLLMVVTNLADGRILEANALVQEVSGLSPSAFLGRTAVELGWITAEERAQVIDLLRAQGALSNHELTVRSQPGGPLDCLVNCQLVTIGGEARVITTLQDISARKRMENELRESRENYRGLFNTVTEAIYVHGTDGIFIDVNEGAQRMYGYTREELIGQTPATVSAPGRNDLAAVARVAAEVAATGRPAVFEFWGRRKNGEPFPKACVTHRGKYFGRDVLITTARDITESRRAEERIREQAALLDVTQDAILVLRLDRIVQYWNRGAERLYGIPAREAVGRSLESLHLRKPPEAIEEEWRQLLARGEWTAERRHVTRERGEVTVQERATVVRNAEGQPDTVLAVITDITAAKRLEAQLLRAQRIESLGSLASGVAHDLNNVLTPILMSIEMLGAAPLPPRERDLVQLLSSSARRGADIVQQLLLFGRGSDSPRTRMSVAEVIREMVQMMRETFPRGIAIAAEVAPDLWRIDGDRTQIHQVILNLCLNSRDAMPGGGLLSLRAQNVRIDAEFAATQSGARPGPHVSIHIQDSGSGIRRDNLDRIFDPFFTTKPIGQGTGLGLATALGIVRGHGGFITVESDVGRGSEFGVFLPAEPATPEPASSAQTQLALGGRGELILVVDDEPGVRSTLGSVLALHHYQVATAGDGIEGVAEFARRGETVRLVITDLMMPLMDGAQAIGAMRRLNPRIPIIAMSGVPSQRAELESTYGPHLRFMPKPFPIERVLTLVRELLEDAARPAGTGSADPTVTPGHP